MHEPTQHHFKMINYKELISAIQSRPKFFLREETIDELDAFLRGVSYANFTQGHEDDFKSFTNEWIPNNLDGFVHDWVETVKSQATDRSSFDMFFELWDTFESSRET